MPSGRYQASANAGPRKTKHLGTHDTAEQAHAAFCAFASQRHGEFFNAG